MAYNWLQMLGSTKLSHRIFRSVLIQMQISTRVQEAFDLSTLALLSKFRFIKRV